MRSRTTVLPSYAKPVFTQIAGDLPYGYRAGGVYADEAHYHVLDVTIPPFTEREEMVDDIVRGWGDWQPFHHYSRKANWNAPSATIQARCESFGQGHWLETTSSGIVDRYYWWEDVLPVEGLWSSGYYGSADNPIVGLGAMYEVQSDGNLRIVPPENLGVLIGQCVQRIMPQAKAELSLINSLYELKDAKTLARTGEKLKASWDGFVRLLGAKPGKRAKYTRMSISDLRRSASDLYLQYKFNIAPLISDTEGFFQSFRNFEAKAKKLVSQSETLRTKHAVIVLPSDGDESLSSDHTLYYRPDSCNLVGKQGRHWRKPESKFHVEMSFTYRYNDFQKQHAAGLALLDKLGINFNPAIVWNAIPWSFAVDWVLGISKYLNKISQANMEPVITIHRSLWSHTYVRYIGTFLQVDKGMFPVSSVVEQAYIRELFVPTSDWIESSGLNSNEWSLIAALAGSRGR